MSSIDDYCLELRFEAFYKSMFYVGFDAECCTSIVNDFGVGVVARDLDVCGCTVVSLNFVE